MKTAEDVEYQPRKVTKTQKEQEKTALFGRCGRSGR